MFFTGGMRLAFLAPAPYNGKKTKWGVAVNSVNKTLYIPLYGKAYVSARGLFLEDKSAEEIWKAEGFPLKGKSKSKWLAYYMGIRSAVFDDWLARQMQAHPHGVVLHLGCGMDSRVLRLGNRGHKWYDVDFPEVIRERERYFSRGETYEMLPGDLRETAWLDAIPERDCAMVVMEGVSMYLKPAECRALMVALSSHFGKLYLLMDCYTEMAAKFSRYKNPINDVGVTRVYGMDDPCTLETEGITFRVEHEMTPESCLQQLQGMEGRIFRKLYAGNFSKKLYRLFENEME